MNDVIYAAAPCLCVENVKAGSDYILHMTFSDGKRKYFDFKPMLSKQIFKPLNSLQLFMQAETDGCGVVWSDEIDIDPTYLYEHGTEE